MDLSLKDPELAAEGENLDLVRCIALVAEGNEVEQGADEGVEEAQDLGFASLRSGRRMPRPSPS